MRKRERDGIDVREREEMWKIGLNMSGMQKEKEIFFYYIYI